MRLLPLSLAFFSCVDGSTGFFVAQNNWAIDSNQVEFNGVPWGTNSFESLVLYNNGTKEVLVTLTLADESSSAFRVMQDSLSVPPDSSAVVDLVFFSSSSDVEHSAVLRVDEARTGVAVDVEVRASVNGDWDSDGHVSENLGGDDCDDSDSKVSPSSTEIWYDGVDQDCDGGSDFDADGDGYDRTPEGGDCDDENAEVHPDVVDGADGAEGVDDDCDGFVDEDSIQQGELLLTEIFVGRNPGPSGYLEIRNAGVRTVNLQGWSVEVNGTPVDLTESGELGPGALLTVCRDSGWAREWTCAGDWGSDFPLGTAGGRATIVSPALVVDQVEWNVDWSLTELVSLQRSTDRQSVEDSRDPSAWCPSRDPLTNGGFGSPGLPNAACDEDP